ncbi:DsbA family protein [Phycicoccus jejuensis]|jgi:protein-disulfide isomerase|uniref:DsbA family protein n=1 Tax=Phycicoccus jejuensis TaxID=367299 RepID=UPI00384E8459
MNRRAIASGVVVAVVIAVVAILTAIARPSAPEARPQAEASSPAAPELVVREDSHRLSKAPAGSPVFVEFLDLECEACRAAYPLVEKLRKDYEGRVEFVIRYFPIDSHANAMNAAVAVEAAARQGKLEEMYSRMYETQAEWGEQESSQAPLFRTFAEDLGLDLSRFDSDVSSADVKARVEKDRQDGLALGVQGTPTFFLDGQMIQPNSEEGLRQLLDAAIAR